jgi:hypothetical protein
MNRAHRRIPYIVINLKREPLLVAQGVLSGAAFAQAAGTITYEQVGQGTLGGPTDAILQDGRPIDRYRLTTQVPNQGYTIFATSPQIPIASTVMYLDPTAGQYVALHRANTFDAGQRALYGGHFAASGHISDRCLSTGPTTIGWQLYLEPVRKR